MKSQTHVGSFTQSTGVPADRELLNESDTAASMGGSGNEQEEDSVCVAAGVKGGLLHIRGLISIDKYMYKHRSTGSCVLLGMHSVMVGAMTFQRKD